MIRIKPEVMNDFWSRIEKDENGCWNWTWALDNKGYGRIRFQGKAWPAHRFSYYAYHRGDLNGRVVHHKCKNPSCVNPDHLEALTRLEHMRVHKEVAGWRTDATPRCRRGHEFTESNIYRRSGGKRQCRECALIYQRNYHFRKTAKTRS